MEKFPYSDTNKRYHTQNYFLRHKFGGKVAKISLNGGFTCPNKDGTKGTGGCTYCSPTGSGDFSGDPCDSISSQFEQGKALLSEKWQPSKFIAYFQPNTGTYAPLCRLKQLYEEALSLPNVAGLAVSTRPDCITLEIADYLASLSERTFLTVELGLQTIHDKTAERINRCHTYEDFLAGYEMLHSRGIPIGVHIINGLPNEDTSMMLETAAALSALDIHSLKIHLLHIIKGTAIAASYESGEFPAMTMEDYVSTVCSQIELMPPKVVIERITGDGSRDTLIAPRWSLDKKRVMNAVDKEFVRRGTMQGSNYKKP
jgi:hypothetical protein